MGELRGSRSLLGRVIGSHEEGWKVGKSEFFESGRREIEEVIGNLGRKRVPLRLGAALDFGCGVGRLSRALSRHFERVLGVNLRINARGGSGAASRLRQHRLPNNVVADLQLIPSEAIDLVYSNIVLQHMPAERQLLFIGEFCRVLRRGGVAVFQTPSWYDLTTLRGCVHFIMGNRLLNIARRAIHGKYRVREIHTLAKPEVLAALEKCGMSIAEINGMTRRDQGV